MLLTQNDVKRRWSTDHVFCGGVAAAPAKRGRPPVWARALHPGVKAAPPGELGALDFMKPSGGSLPRHRAFGRALRPLRSVWPIDVPCRSGKG